MGVSVHFSDTSTAAPRTGWAATTSSVAVQEEEQQRYLCSGRLALVAVLEQSVKQMANICRRPHLDVLDANMAFVINLEKELRALPSELRCSCQFKLNKVLHQYVSLYPIVHRRIHRIKYKAE